MSTEKQIRHGFFWTIGGPVFVPDQTHGWVSISGNRKPHKVWENILDGAIDDIVKKLLKKETPFGVEGGGE